MLFKTKTLTGYKLECLDGIIGEVKEFYFDDWHWTIRYLVAQTGNWLIDRQVLISPYALAGVLKVNEHIRIDLTKKQIEESPSCESDKPVSRQYEEYYNEYYGWPEYWGGVSMWGHHPYPMRDRDQWKIPTADKKKWDHHLRSTDNVRGYYIQAIDGELGHVDDFILDDETWAIRYLVVSTRNWWPGKKVLVSPKWIQRVSWEDSTVFVNLSRDTIQQSPEYREDSLLTRDYEIRLHGYYNRQGYWIEEPAYQELDNGKTHDEKSL